MRKGLFTLMIVLAASSAALAEGIDQMQGFAVGLANDINLLVSGQSASSDNFLTVLNTQFAGTSAIGTVGQDPAAILNQVGAITSEPVWAAMAAVTLPTPESVDFTNLFSAIDGIGSFTNP